MTQYHSHPLVRVFMENPYTELYDLTIHDCADAMAHRIVALYTALTKIAEWELPKTNQTWPSGDPVSYEANHGSEGAKRYIRTLAHTALKDATGTINYLNDATNKNPPK